MRMKVFHWVLILAYPIVGYTEPKWCIIRRWVIGLGNHVLFKLVAQRGVKISLAANNSTLLSIFFSILSLAVGDTCTISFVLISPLVFFFPSVLCLLSFFGIQVHFFFLSFRVCLFQLPIQLSNIADLYGF